MGYLVRNERLRFRDEQQNAKGETLLAMAPSTMEGIEPSYIN